MLYYMRGGMGSAQEALDIVWTCWPQTELQKNVEVRLGADTDAAMNESPLVVMGQCVPGLVLSRRADVFHVR